MDPTLLAWTNIERARFQTTARHFSVSDAFVEGLLARHAAEPDHPNPEKLLLKYSKERGDPLARLADLQRAELLCYWCRFTATYRSLHNQA